MTLPNLSESALLLVRTHLALHEKRKRLQKLSTVRDAGSLKRGEYTARRKYHMRSISESKAIIRAIYKTVPRCELHYVKWVVRTVTAASNL